MYSFYFFPTIYKPTRIKKKTKTLIDNIFVRNFVSPFSGLIVSDLSDHFPIFSVVSQNHKPFLTTKTDSFVRPINAKGLRNLSNSLHHYNWDFISDSTDVNSDFNKLHGILIAKLNFCLPEVKASKQKSFKQPWMTAALLKSITKKHQLYKAALSDKYNWSVYKKYRNTLTSLIRTRKESYFSNFVNEHKKDAKAVWKIINDRLGKNVCINNNSDNPNFNKISANEMNDFFVNLGPNTTLHIKPSCSYKDYMHHSVRNSMYLTPTTSNEIISIVNSCKPKLSAGYDGISMKILKIIIPYLAEPLSKIINKSFLLGCFPTACKIAKIIPIFKSGSRSDLKNYRPISLLSCFSKIIETLMKNRLCMFLNRYNLINNSQHGFRANFSTTTALTDVLHTVTNSLDKKHLAIALFIDISKAFDSLNHAILLDKLQMYGIRGVALNWFESYLDCRCQFTVLNCVRSEFRHIKAGVPQGSVLGPTLFLLYVNDIFLITSNVKCVLYADDTTLIFSANDVNILFSCANVLFKQYSDWFSSNLLAINTDKTNYMIFGGIHVDMHYNLIFNDVILKRAVCVKYLGILLDCMLTWQPHIKFIADKVNKGVGMLKLVRRILPKFCLINIYYSFIYSYITNAIVFWGIACEKYLHPLIIAQKHAIRIIGSVNRLTHCAPIAKSNNILFINDVYKLSLACLMFSVNAASSHPILLDNISKISLHYHYSTRSALCNKFWVPRVFSNYCKYFVIYQGIILWNDLPSCLTNIKSVHRFKSHFKLLFFESYV
jgi:hypothetical protein